LTDPSYSTKRDPASGATCTEFPVNDPAMPDGIERLDADADRLRRLAAASEVA
jgi:hypothetical protein